MARLTDEEKRLLRKLQEKAEAPDSPAVARSASFTIDLGDEKQLARAAKLGLIDMDDDSDSDNDEDDNGEPADDVPKRRGYFKE